MVRSSEARRHVARQRREDVKLGRSLGWNPVRDERSEVCIYAYVERSSRDAVSVELTSKDGNACDLRTPDLAAVSSLRLNDEFSRQSATMTVELLPGESRGYWKHHAPDKWFKQAKATGKINNEKAQILFDSGAEVSILDTDFARKVGCYVDGSQRQECVGIGENTYMTDGRTKIKVTLAGSLVYYCQVWVGRLAGQDAILGMDFMVPAGVRLDLADGSVCLPDEVRIRLQGRRQLFSSKARLVTPDSFLSIAPGDFAEVMTRPSSEDKQVLWVTRGKNWVATVAKGLGRTRYIRITNVGEEEVKLDRLQRIGIWISGGHIPRLPGFVSVGSNRYREWQNLAYSATTDQQSRDNDAGDDEVPNTEKVSYPTPEGILERPSPAVAAVVRSAEDHIVPPQEDRNDPTGEQSPQIDEAVYYHKGGELFAEDIEAQMAILPEVTPGTDEVKIEDIQVGDPDVNTIEEIDQLRSIIWDKRHLLMGKGNALPPKAKGAVCDIDVGNARPVAQRVRRVPPQFREKVAELLKGLLSARIVQPSTSPWASPIVVIVKKNGVDIRLCIDYRLVNSLTQLMVYPMPIVNDLLEDLDKVLWFCSLDMASGFWVVEMTQRAREISAFITPFGLFEWNRMPFGLKNAPQIYQRLIDNTLYGFMKIAPATLESTDRDPAGEDTPPKDVFTSGVPDVSTRSSVLGRRSYIDDILVTSGSWEELCAKVKRLLDACDKWNLSISVPKSYWGRRRVEYLGHQVTIEGLEAHPKNLDELMQLPFPRTLRGLQSFLGSLNYYHRFIEDFAVYAAALYELRETDFHAMPPEDQLHEDLTWGRAVVAFKTLKSKLSHMPFLKHFDKNRPAVLVIYAGEWAVAAALVQDHDGTFHPTKFCNRTLKPNELNYSVAEKEILALLRALDNCFNMLIGQPVKVLTRHTTMAWLWRSHGLQGRLAQWAAILSPWTLEIVKCSKGEEEILGTLAACITPRDQVDEALVAIAPKKKALKSTAMPVPTVLPGEQLLVVSFDGSARTKRGGGAFSAIVWQLPEWEILNAASEYCQDLTVNEAEYRGLLLALDLLETQDRSRLVICGDSNLVIRQLTGEIDCKAPGLQLLRQQALERLQSWDRTEYLHVKCDWNRSADFLVERLYNEKKAYECQRSRRRRILKT